ncbi:MAG: sigma-54 dependent transcriptional regulator [Pseudomonadota bacterium]
MYRILVSDDDPEVLEFISEVLQRAGYEVGTAANGQLAIDELDSNSYDLAITDLNMPEIDGMAVLNHIVTRCQNTLCIILTGYGSIRGSVEAIKIGAFDYVPKPVKSEELLMIVEKAFRYQSLERENMILKDQLRQKYRFENFIGNSPAILKVFEVIEKVADTDSTILITGASGTGKELVARAIHYNSRRRNKPMVTINCGAIPEELLESELFGHEKGAFTSAHKARVGRFEIADGGTIFLDEIGDMSPNLQVKLLRVLQEQKFERVGSAKTLYVDIRVVAATNTDLKEAIAKGAFREDLYYRLNVIPIHVPPLKERKSDIPLLLDFFMHKFTNKKHKHIKGLRPETVAILLKYDWPGNVRELENLIERLVILSNNEMIGTEDLPDNMLEGSEVCAELLDVIIPEGGIPFNTAVEEYERQLILQALNKAKWVKKKAAELLCINRTTLVEKIKKKNIVHPRIN